MIFRLASGLLRRLERRLRRLRLGARQTTASETALQNTAAPFSETKNASHRRARFLARSAGRQNTTYGARGRVNRTLWDAAHKSSSTFVIVGFFVVVVVVATVVFVVVVIAIEEVQTRLSLAANS